MGKARSGTAGPAQARKRVGCRRVRFSGFCRSTGQSGPSEKGGELTTSGRKNPIRTEFWSEKLVYRPFVTEEVHYATCCIAGLVRKRTTVVGRRLLPAVLPVCGALARSDNKPVRVDANREQACCCLPTDPKQAYLENAKPSFDGRVSKGSRFGGQSPAYGATSVRSPMPRLHRSHGVCRFSKMVSPPLLHGSM